MNSFAGQAHSSAGLFLKSPAFEPIDYYRGAWCGHLPFAYDFVLDFRPQKIVELGSHKGQSYFAFCKAIADAQLPASAYAIDTWEGDPHAGFYEESVFDRFQQINQRLFQPFSTMVRKTFDEALIEFDDASIDLLHIDGLHTYEAVRHDFETWRSKLKNPGVVFFHDTAVREKDFGVWKFWDEVRQQYASFEFEHSNGLGVLFIGDQSEFRSENGLIMAMFDQTQHEALKSLYRSVAALFDQAHLLPGVNAELNAQLRQYKRELRFCRRFSLMYLLRRLLKSPSV